jgi:PhzF family phenazine biosynthesis protein
LENERKYCGVDVFTGERFKGNPLSVVFIDSDLPLSTYEDISREFGYSETSFVYYSKPDKALKIRSFTPAGFEVNGAGHNLLGAVCAALLLNMEIFHEQHGESFVIMKDAKIRLTPDQHPGNLPFIGMLQKHAVIEASIDPESISEALTLHPAEIITGNLIPTVVKTEVTHLMVPVADLHSLNSSVPKKPLLINLADKYNFEGVYCYTILKNDPQYFVQARFFNPQIGIEEDPATGSAAGPLAGFLLHNDYVRPNTRYQILQGEKMNHPSTIIFEIKPEGIWISGSAVMVMEGIIHT